jgi:N-acetylglucosaminyldiphosphoundecaprenol N-acetyl-beta-D-mannosaminyltransferase
MEAYDSQEFRKIVNTSDIVTPDGMPLVWALRHKGYPHQERVYGPTLMLKILDAASKEGIPVGFMGSTDEILHKLAENMTTKFPGLIVSIQIAPPFRPLSREEDQRIIEEIRDSGVKILFVALGCPKQEQWIADHYGRIQAVMVGVGAAFALHAGIVPQAPNWVQKMGFEWLYRLFQEPHRLWKRYLSTNPRFIFLIFRELIMEKVSHKRQPEC